MDKSECLFCEIMANESEPLLINERGFVAAYDHFPVNKGHVLIYSRRHIKDIFGLTPLEFSDLHYIINYTKNILDDRFKPDGYNIGANCGEAAGQTIMHFHLHVIPRYKGDVEKPRGGVRNIKPALVPY